MRNLFKIALVIWALTGVFSPAPATAQTLSAKVLGQDLRNRYDSGQESLRVIALLKDWQALKGVAFSPRTDQGQSLRKMVAQAQAGVIQRMSGRGFSLNARYENLPALAATVTPLGLRELASLEEVALIQEDKPIYPAGPPLPLPASGSAKPRDASDVFSGRNVSIAIVGSGIDYMNPYMGENYFPNSKVIGGYDFGDNDPDPLDCHGHETGVAFIAADTVASQAKLYALKICPGCCETEPSWVSLMVAAWDWCLTHRDDNPAFPIKIINTSWADYSINHGYCDQANPAVALAASACKAAGIAIFIAAGNNNNCDALPMPSCISDVYAVGAVYEVEDSPKTYCLPWQGCLSWPSSACGGWEWACRDDVVQPDKVSCCSNSADFLPLLAYSGGYTSGSAPYAAGAAAILQSYLKEAWGYYPEVDRMMEVMTGYISRITDYKSGISTPRVSVPELIQGLQGGN